MTPRLTWAAIAMSASAAWDGESDRIFGSFAPGWCDPLDVSVLAEIATLADMAAALAFRGRKLPKQKRI